MSHLHPEITDEEYFLVVNRMAPIEAVEHPEGGFVFLNETPEEWFARNVANFGEAQAVEWFKAKAARQARIEASSK